MATKNIVPRANNEGSLGTSTKKWASVYATNFVMADGETVATKISNQNTRITTAEGSVTTLSGTVDTLSSDVTTLYGNVETLSDGKLNITGGTLTGDLTVKNAQVLIKESNFVRGGQTTNQFLHTLRVTDNNDKPVASLYTEMKSDNKLEVALQAYNPTTTDDTNAQLGIGYDTSGNIFTRCPTPATNDSSTKIATTSFVNKYVDMAVTAKSVQIRTAGFLTASSTQVSFWLPLIASASLAKNITVSLLALRQNGSYLAGSSSSESGCTTSYSVTINKTNQFLCIDCFFTSSIGGTNNSPIGIVCNLSWSV